VHRCGDDRSWRSEVNIVNVTEEQEREDPDDWWRKNSE
jgi:hypothetical protein